jgi:hypothetical protein
MNHSHHIGHHRDMLKANTLAVALAFAFLAVIPSGNLLSLRSWLSWFIARRCPCFCFSCCHSQRESAAASLMAVLLIAHS